MNEEKTKIVTGFGKMEQSPESKVGVEDPESISELKARLAAVDQEEADAFAARGYGGYINTDALEHLRGKKAAIENALATAQRRGGAA